MQVSSSASLRTAYFHYDKRIPENVKTIFIVARFFKSTGRFAISLFPPPRANMEAVSQLYYDPKVVADLSGDWDSVVVVAKNPKDLPASLASIASAIKAHIEVSSL